MANDIEVALGDVGLQFLIEIEDANNPGNVVDLSKYGNFTIYFKKPDKSRLTVKGVLFSDGTDGLLYYISHPSDIDVPGQWMVQVSYTFGNSKIYTTKETFIVFDDLNDEEN